MSSRRFRIAFSFAGEKRNFVAQVANILAKQFGESAILYDKFHEAEFARYDLGIYLPKLYAEQSDLIVPVLCSNYDKKRWTGWEWLQIHGLLTKSDGQRVMPCRFDYATADGLSPAAGFVELDDKTPLQTASLILQRLALNEGKPCDHHNTASDETCSPSPRKENNPFQTVAAIPHDHLTYIPRQSDDELKRLLSGPNRLISITGDFGIGKSSLMQQAKRILPNHQFFGGGLADLGGEDETRFMNNFFKSFAKKAGKVTEWGELEDHFSQHPSVLFLDDLGEVAAPGLAALIPALVTKIAEPDFQLRVITTTREKLKTIFAKRDLENPKYYRPWKNIQVDPLEPAGVRQLLGLLPSRSRALGLAQQTEVEKHSQLKPQMIQCLCHRLYDAECDDASGAQLTALIKNEASYE